MVTYAEYFDKNRPKPKFKIGDRVYGKWNKLPFVGTVLNDNVVTEEIGPQVSVHLDLPLKHKETYINIVRVTQNSIKKLTMLT
jgi:hypothetical protein